MNHVDSIHTRQELDVRRTENLRRRLRPSSVVVIGAPADPAKAGSQALLSLRYLSGSVVAVHPR